MNNVQRLKETMGWEAFSEYISGIDGLAHIVLLMAWIEDENFWGSIGDSVDDDVLEAIETAIDNMDKTKSLFPKVYVKNSSIRIKKSKTNTYRIYGSYFTPDTRFILSWWTLLEYRFDRSDRIYLKIQWGDTKWKFDLTIENEWGSITFPDYIVVV